MKSINLDDYQNELKTLLETAPEDTKRIYVLDSSGEVDKVLDFQEVQELFDYLWDQLQTVPLVYVVKIKKIKRVEIRVKQFSALFEIKKGKMVFKEFHSKTSVSKSGLYLKLQ